MPRSLEVDDTLVEDLALVLAGATHDHHDLSVVTRRIKHVRQASVEVFRSAIRHRCCSRCVWIGHRMARRSMNS